MIELLKKIAKENQWDTIIGLGEPHRLCLSKRDNDIINDSHFRNDIITVESISRELELLANLLCEKDGKTIAAAGIYNGKQWGVIVK